MLINGGGSGTYQAACLAKSMFEEEQGEGKMTIEVIDSARPTPIFTDTLLSRLPKCASRASSFDAIVSVVKSRLNRVEAYLGVYSLKFLKKSGRISGGAAFVGEALGLKPISHVYDGAVKVCDKVRGEKALVAGMSKKSPPVWCSRISRRLSCSTATYPPSVWMKWKSCATEIGFRTMWNA
ncbi:MAG: DegV family protein [Butyricicoccaceae bacterium]